MVQVLFWRSKCPGVSRSCVNWVFLSMGIKVWPVQGTSWSATTVAFQGQATTPCQEWVISFQCCIICSQGLRLSDEWVSICLVNYSTWHECFQIFEIASVDSSQLVATHTLITLSPGTRSPPASPPHAFSVNLSEKLAPQGFRCQMFSVKREWSWVFQVVAMEKVFSLCPVLFGPVPHLKSEGEPNLHCLWRSVALQLCKCKCSGGGGLFV